MAVMREVWWRETHRLAVIKPTVRYGGAMAVIREVWWSDGCDQANSEVRWSDGCDERGMVERWL